MPYQPNYCSHCGEKVERAEWNILTSRKFCARCEVLFKKEEWTARLATAGVLIFGLFGFGTYLTTPANSASTSGGRFLKSSTNAVAPKNENASGATNRVVIPAAANVVTPTPKPVSKAPSSVVAPLAASAPTSGTRQNAEPEAVYYCGAETKKGTPCSRKVKDGGRCWQHQGSPSDVGTPAARRAK